ncbi:MAG: [Lachnospiraceae bacterium]|nr:[FeFe] hydrogenase, group A [Lachnospiraceae bacterium]
MREIYGGQLDENVRVVIDGQVVLCPENSTILEAAKMANIEIPTLCYLKGLTPTGECGMCVVEITYPDGKKKIGRSCRLKAKDGIEVVTHSEELTKLREKAIKTILDKHPNDCLTCQKTNGNCHLQEVTHLFGINPEERKVPKRTLDETSVAFTRDMSKCIACGRCVTVCNDVQKIKIYEMYTDPKTGDRYQRVKGGKMLSDTNCINCGQCVKVCPVAALTEKDSIKDAIAAIDDPSVTIVWEMAPAIQNTLGEEFGLPTGSDVTRKIAAAMKALGGYAYTTDFSADLTIMEEGTEFIDRVSNGGVLPMMTSCCPGWIRYMEYNYPDQLDHLSSCKSPQQMFGALVKNYLPKKIGVDAKKICHISIMPCTAKKFERSREEMGGDYGKDVDIVLTTREAAKLFKFKGIDLATIKEDDFDSLMGCGTGAARIFSTTGGVMEAALRTVVWKLTNGKIDTIDYVAARGYKGVKEATLNVNGMDVKIAVVNGIGNVKPVMDDVRAGKSPYHFIEVMACPGGCVNGGGAPLVSDPSLVGVRTDKTYESDKNNKIRRSHENPEIQAIYADYLKEPCGHISHHILHTTYTDRSKTVKK